MAKASVKKQVKSKTAAKPFQYKPQYGVIVICKDEREQKKIFDSLQAKGHPCKIVVV